MRDKLQKKLELRQVLGMFDVFCEHLKRRNLQEVKTRAWACNLQEKLLFIYVIFYTNKKWQRVKFTDKKKFNLDGPSLLSSWFTKGATTSESSTFPWEGISYYGKVEIKFITGKLNSKKYILKQLTNKWTRMRHELPEINPFSNRAHRESNKTIICKQKNSCFRMIGHVPKTWTL